MSQIARPDADTIIGNFQNQAEGTTNIFLTIDEVAQDDADYVRSPSSPTNEVYVCRLSDAVDPVSSVNHIMRMRTGANPDIQEPINFTQQLRQGYVSEAVQGTLIASQTRIGVTSAGFTTTAYTLSVAETNAITDYTALFYRFIVSRT